MASYNVKRTMGRGQRGNLVRQNKMKEVKWVAKNNQQLPRNQQNNNLQINTFATTPEDNDADSEDESRSPTTADKVYNNSSPTRDVSKSVRFVVDDVNTQQNTGEVELQGGEGYQQLPEKPQSDDTDEAGPVLSNIDMNLQTLNNETEMLVDNQEIPPAATSIPSPPTTQIEDVSQKVG